MAQHVFLSKRISLCHSWTLSLISFLSLLPAICYQVVCADTGWNHEGTQQTEK